MLYIIGHLCFEVKTYFSLVAKYSPQLCVVFPKIFLDFISNFQYNIPIYRNTKEICMLDYTTALIVFGVCLWGCSQTAFHLGRRDGIEGTVQYLIDQGVLEVDDEG